MSSDSCNGQPPQQDAVAPQPTPSHTVDHEGLTRVLQPQKKQKKPVLHDDRRMFRRPFTPADVSYDCQPTCICFHKLYSIFYANYYNHSKLSIFFLTQILFEMTLNYFFILFSAQIKMFAAAQDNTPIRFMVNPPEGKDSARLTNVYLDTSTLEWLYQPPIPAISLRNPEYKNLSSKYAV